jgi:hypothetical protein
MIGPRLLAWIEQGRNPIRVWIEGAKITPFMPIALQAR